MGSFLTREELRSLAGGQPVDPAWHRKMQRAFRTWASLLQELRDDPSIRDEIKSEMKNAVGRHRLVWKVRGITGEALEALLGGANGYTKDSRAGFQRAHLHTWDGLIDGLMSLPMGTGFTEWVSHVWELDVTVICTGADENRMLDSTLGAPRGWFDKNVITFKNEENLFDDTGTSFRWRKGKEWAFLKKV